jgi:acid phosphatase class B
MFRNGYRFFTSTIFEKHKTSKQQAKAIKTMHQRRRHDVYWLIGSSLRRIVSLLQMAF